MEYSRITTGVMDQLPGGLTYKPYAHTEMHTLSPVHHFLTHSLPSPSLDLVGEVFAVPVDPGGGGD